MKPVNIVLGRFQPFTIGHLKLAEYAYNEKGLQTVLVVISTPDNKLDERHPFPTKALAPFFDKLCKQNPHILDWIEVKNADIVKASEALRKRNGYNLKAWTCGSDRYDAYVNQCKKYWEMAGLSEEPEVLVCSREDNISATGVRETLKNQDRKAFEKLVPDIFRGFFNVGVEYMEQLNKGLKPLTRYMLEAIQNLKEFTLGDMMDWGVWVPNDDVSHDDMENIISAIQKQWPADEGNNYPISTINNLPIICQLAYNKRDIKFIVFQYSVPDKEVVKAVQEIADVIAQTVYSTVGGEDEIKRMLKHLK